MRSLYNSTRKLHGPNMQDLPKGDCYLPRDRGVKILMRQNGDSPG